MDEKELFYRRERLVPREPALVERKPPKEKVFTDPLILTSLVILAIMIIIVLVLYFT